MFVKQTVNHIPNDSLIGLRPLQITLTKCYKSNNMKTPFTKPHGRRLNRTSPGQVWQIITVLVCCLSPHRKEWNSSNTLEPSLEGSRFESSQATA
jgi:hypothetical protein